MSEGHVAAAMRICVACATSYSRTAVQRILFISGGSGFQPSSPSPHSVLFLSRLFHLAGPHIDNSSEIPKYFSPYLPTVSRSSSYSVGPDFSEIFRIAFTDHIDSCYDTNQKRETRGMSCGTMVVVVVM